MQQHQSPQRWRCAGAALLGIALVTGCGSATNETAPGEVPSFEEYKESARLLMVDGQPIYNVEFDLFFDEEGLYQHYLELLQPPAESELFDKSVVIRQISTGEDLTFQRGSDALTITYCVSTAFGSKQALAIQDMRDATADWQAVTNVRFEYVPSMNGSCVGGATGIDVAVIPSIQFEAACATPPYFPASQQGFWCAGYTQGTLGFDYANWPWSSADSSTTSRGVMRHELGHILGLRHEHAFGPLPCTGEGPSFGDIDGRQLTPYDINSVMHYPWCGNGIWTFPISERDGWGVRELYGMPAAWYPALSQPALL